MMSRFERCATGKPVAKIIPTDTYDEVLQAIARFPDGASIEQIEEQLPAPPNRRTLQRWLNHPVSLILGERSGRDPPHQ
jgi:hypothetical protein